MVRSYCDSCALYSTTPSEASSAVQLMVTLVLDTGVTTGSEMVGACVSEFTYTIWVTAG